MNTLLTPRDFDESAHQIAVRCFIALEDVMHHRKCFPLLNEQPEIVKQALYQAIRRGMSTVAIAAQAHSVAAGILAPTQPIPQPPSPL